MMAPFQAANFKICYISLIASILRNIETSTVNSTTPENDFLHLPHKTAISRLCLTVSVTSAALQNIVEEARTLLSSVMW